MDMNLGKMWYLPVHKVWIIAGKDFTIYQFRFDNKQKITLEKPAQLHSDEITTLIEITSPTKMIITGGMDKKIVMFSLVRN
jgi:hypothetical protein